MGGSGSGRESFRRTVEECLVFSLSAMLRDGQLTEHESTQVLAWEGWQGVTRYRLTVEIWPIDSGLLFQLQETHQIITLQASALRFGGRRWWFDCPKCERRCAKLYLPPHRDEFACRICYNLQYRSERESDSVPIILMLAMKLNRTPEEIKQTLRELTRKNRARPRWVRKRDRRWDYLPRGSRLSQKER
jgi:hypothetical protein